MNEIVTQSNEKGGELAQQSLVSLMTQCNEPQRDFLAAYKASGNVARAAEESDILPSEHERFLATNDAYREAFEMCHALWCYKLEHELFRRGVEGVEEPIFEKGKKVGVRIKYSEQDLQLLVKGNIPKYKNAATVEINNTTTNNTQNNIVNMSEEERKRFLEDTLQRAREFGVEFDS